MIKTIARELWEYVEVYAILVVFLALVSVLLILTIIHNPHAVIKNGFFKDCVRPEDKAKALTLLQADRGKLFEVQIGDETKYYYLPKDTELKAGNVIITQYILDDKFLHEITELANFTDFVKGGRIYETKNQKLSENK